MRIVRGKRGGKRSLYALSLEHEWNAGAAGLRGVL